MLAFDHEEGSLQRGEQRYCLDISVAIKSTSRREMLTMLSISLKCICTRGIPGGFWNSRTDAKEFFIICQVINIQRTSVIGEIYPDKLKVLPDIEMRTNGEIWSDWKFYPNPHHNTVFQGKVKAISECILNTNDWNILLS